LLVEHLHLVQDSHGCLTARHLAALAAEMRLSQADVYEVATFYAHFDVLEDGETPPPPLTVRICEGISCELAGSRDLAAGLGGALGPDVRVTGAPCVGACHKAPVAVVGKRQIGEATVAIVQAAAEADLTDPEMPSFKSFDDYQANGGYRILNSLIAGERSRSEVIDAVEASGFRGLGGAGFPLARKWRFLLDAPKPRLMAINADEGEPGTFKDRHCLNTDPHRVLEGALISAWTIEAEQIYVYLRDEYPETLQILAQEIKRVEAAGLNGGVKFHLRRGAGAYICGEESAMLESIEGKRGLPRNRPPFPAQSGLFGRPTLINNVETLYHLRGILEHGGERYQEAGRPRFYSVSGRVRKPGIKLAPSGVTARQLIEEYSGGMLDGHVFRGYLPGGASGGILPATLADLPLDFDTLWDRGCFVGSGALVVLSDKDDMREVVANLLRFFEDESCGQCTPCRVGCEKMLKLIDQPVWDQTLITELGETMRDASICGLGQAAPNPVLSAMRFFAEDIR
jgi:formate dehydrogenase